MAREIRVFDKTSDLVGTGNFTFNEDVSEYLQIGDEFYVIIHFTNTVTWNNGENTRKDFYIEQCETTYLGDGVFSRGSIRMSSNNNERVDFPAGTKIVDAKLTSSQAIRNAQNVSVSNSSIGINVASASMPLHIEAEDCAILQYDTSAPISDSRPAWITGPNGPNWRIGSTNSTSSPIANEIGRLSLTPDGVFTVANSVTVGANVYMNATHIKTPNTGLITATAATGNGYTYLTGGILMQWGWVAANSSVGNATFPIAFPSALFSYSAVSNTVDTDPAVLGYGARVIGANTTVLQVRTSQTTTKNCHYIAIGV